VNLPSVRVQSLPRRGSCFSDAKTAGPARRFIVFRSSFPCRKITTARFDRTTFRIRTSVAHADHTVCTLSPTATDAARPSLTAVQRTLSLSARSAALPKARSNRARRLQTCKHRFAITSFRKELSRQAARRASPPTAIFALATTFKYVRLPGTRKAPRGTRRLHVQAGSGPSITHSRGSGGAISVPRCYCGGVSLVPGGFLSR
jgi:hypothetical protein